MRKLKSWLFEETEEIRSPQLFEFYLDGNHIRIRELIRNPNPFPIIKVTEITKDKSEEILGE